MGEFLESVESLLHCCQHGSKLVKGLFKELRVAGKPYLP